MSKAFILSAVMLVVSLSLFAQNTSSHPSADSRHPEAWSWSLFLHESIGRGLNSNTAKYGYFQSDIEVRMTNTKAFSLAYSLGYKQTYNWEQNIGLNDFHASFSNAQTFNYSLEEIHFFSLGISAQKNILGNWIVGGGLALYAPFLNKGKLFTQSSGAEAKELDRLNYEIEKAFPLLAL